MGGRGQQQGRRQCAVAKAESGYGGVPTNPHTGAEGPEPNATRVPARQIGAATLPKWPTAKPRQGLSHGYGLG